MIYIYLYNTHFFFFFSHSPLRQKGSYHLEKVLKVRAGEVGRCMSWWTVPSCFGFTFQFSLSLSFVFDHRKGVRKKKKV